MIPKRYISLINVSLFTLLAALGIYVAWDNYRNWYFPEKEDIIRRKETAPRTVPTPPASQYDLIVSRNLWKEKFAAPVDLPPPTPQTPSRPSAQTEADRNLDQRRPLQESGYYRRHQKQNAENLPHRRRGRGGQDP